MAEDVDSDALAMLILNKHHAGVKVITWLYFEVTLWGVKPKDNTVRKRDCLYVSVFFKRSPPDYL